MEGKDHEKGTKVVVGHFKGQRKELLKNSLILIA